MVVRYLNLSCWINLAATPTSNFQLVGLLDPECCYKFTYLVAGSVGPDQLATLFAKAGYIQVQQDNG